MVGHKSTGKGLRGPLTFPEPRRRKKEGHKEEAYGLLACDRNFRWFPRILPIVQVSGLRRRRPDAIRKVPFLQPRIEDRRLVASRRPLLGRLLVGQRADRQVVEQPEDGRDKRPCFHDSFPRISFSVSAPAGKFPEPFCAGAARPAGTGFGTRRTEEVDQYRECRFFGRGLIRAFSVLGVWALSILRVGIASRAEFFQGRQFLFHDPLED
jgi:hypothetical protein